MKQEAVFHQFDEHDEITVTDVDHVAGTVRFVSTRTGRRERLPFPKNAVVASSIQKARTLHVRYGEPAECSPAKGRWAGRAAGRSIADVRHTAPVITMLSFSVLRWAMGDGRMTEELSRFRDHASTVQKTADFIHHGVAFSLELGHGRIRTAAVLPGGHEISHEGLIANVELPLTVVTGMTGRRMNEVVDHPSLADPRLIVAAASHGAGGRTHIKVVQTAISIDQALDEIRLQTRIAA